MAHEEKEVLRYTMKGMSLRAKLVAYPALAVPAFSIMAAIYTSACYAVRQEIVHPLEVDLITLLLVGLALYVMLRFFQHRVDRAVLRGLGQWTEKNHERGKSRQGRKKRTTLREALGSIVPTLRAWKWLALAWVVLNLLDILSTELGLSVGGVEGNPVVRASFEAGQNFQSYVTKLLITFGVLVLTCAYKKKTILTVLTAIMGLVVASNFSIYFSYLVQPELTQNHVVDPNGAVFAVRMAYLLLIVTAVGIWTKREKLRGKLSGWYRELRYGEAS